MRGFIFQTPMANYGVTAAVGALIGAGGVLLYNKLTGKKTDISRKCKSRKRSHTKSEKVIRRKVRHHSRKNKSKPSQPAA